jgi:hypothetical protein
MKTFLWVFAVVVLVAVLINYQLKTFRKKHPNAEMLMRFYQMII